MTAECLARGGSLNADFALAFAGCAGALALGADEVDQRVLTRDGVRFDPSGKGRAMKDWLESSAEPAEWTELALGAIAFTASDA